MRRQSAAALPIDTSPLDEDLDRRFSALRSEWLIQRGPTSSPRRMINLPDYREVVAMGQAVIPLLLAELEREPDFWFAALREITGANPVLPEHRGNLRAMSDDWLAWGRQLGYR